MTSPTPADLQKIIAAVSAALGPPSMGEGFPNPVAALFQAGNTVVINPNGLFIYSGTPTLGNLIFAIGLVTGTDPYGNGYSAGINAQDGILTGVQINSSTLDTVLITLGTLVAPTISNPSIAGGTITETTITFDTVGGQLFAYSNTTTTVTLTSGASWTAPAGSYTTGKVETWGADAGAGGGNATQGGEAGGGAAYSCNPSYPLTPGRAYVTTIGAAGNGGVTNVAGTDGGRTDFDNGGVAANGGRAGSAGVGGLGGAASGSMPISFAGGNGGSNPSGFTSSAGGGGRAGSTGAGGTGGNPTGNGSPGFGGSAGTGTGGIVGSNGVVANTNGNGGNAGGAGAGAASGVTTKTVGYDPTSTDCYYGSGNLKNHNGTLFQGAASGYAGITGNQFGFVNYNFAQIQSDFSGWTIDQVKLTINCQGAWYNSGGYISYGYANSGGNHFSQSYYWVNAGATNGPTDVTAVLGSKIAGGAASFEALTIGPDPSFQDLNNYVYFQGGAGQGGPRIGVTGHQGAGSKTGGNGSGGKIVITYSNASTLVFALSPAAGTDGGPGNAFGLGYTGPVQAFSGATPTTVETWHTLSLATGLSGSIRYKKVAETNMVIIDLNISWTGATAQTFIIGSFRDSTYYPTVLPPGNGRQLIIGGNWTSPAAYVASQVPRLFIPPSGALNVIVPATSVQPSNVSACVIFPTD